MSANENHHVRPSGQSKGCYRLAVFRGGVGWLISSEGGYTVLLFKVSSFECVKFCFSIKMYKRARSPVGFLTGSMITGRAKGSSR